MSRSLAHGDPHEPLALGQNEPDQRRVGRGEYARRRSLLRADPDIEVVDMATLVGVAKAIEDEAVRRYELLAALMERRGESATAAAFRVMLEEERSHVAAVERWSASVGETVLKAEDFEWMLPADLSSSWDEISGSVLLTPYRAFALAVENEERAFSFYAYLAAHAESARIRAEAEKLGAEELRHASLLRRFRRRAYHRERDTAAPAELKIESVEMLREVLAQHETVIAAAHRALAHRLRRAGDEASAQVLDRSIASTTLPPTHAATSSPAYPVLDADEAPVADDPAHLLVDAQKPLEALANTLEAVMATAEGELFDAAANATGSVIERIARISLQIGRSNNA